jgi:hypothetical protein
LFYNLDDGCNKKRTISHIIPSSEILGLKPSGQTWGSESQLQVQLQALMSLITSALMMEAETVCKILDCNFILVAHKNFIKFTRGCGMDFSGSEL